MYMRSGAKTLIRLVLGIFKCTRKLIIDKFCTTPSSILHEDSLPYVLQLGSQVYGRLHYFDSWEKLMNLMTDDSMHACMGITDSPTNNTRQNQQKLSCFFLLASLLSKIRTYILKLWNSSTHVALGHLVEKFFF
jgi:hypothetical protein